jgi:hypothetical protein
LRDELARRSEEAHRFARGAPGTNFSAVVEDCEANIRDAIAFHLEGMREAGETIPGPSAVAATVVEVPAA